MTQARGDGGRLAGAIWGMFVGDAFCLGSHWIYDEDAFIGRFPEGPGGFDAPADGHDHAGKRPGALTHYGEGALILLESLAEADLDADAYGSRLVRFYGRADHGSYVDKPTRHLLAARRELDPVEPFTQGADDDQNVSTSRLAPLVARLAGEPRLMLEVDRFTRVLQENDRAVAYACTHARLLEALFAGADLDDAIDATLRGLDARTELGAEIAGLIAAARTAATEPVETAVERWGRACRLVQAFPAALQAALAHADDPAAAIAATARARGDNASRAMLVGSWLGARHGVEAWPEAWRARLIDGDRIAAGMARLLARRPRRPAGVRH